MGQFRHVEIIAHRGSSRLAPENTLASLKLGWQETTMCEMDVQPTLDGKLLVIHDDSTKRTTGINLKVARHALSQLQQLDAGAWKGSRWIGQKLPSLDEAIHAMPSGKKLLIEIKAGPEVIAELARVIHASGKQKQVLVHSFSCPACVEVRKALPRIPVYLLIASRQNPLTEAWSPTIKRALAQALKAKLEGIGVNDTILLNADAIQNVHAAGLKINIWTVDRVRQAKKLIRLGVDGLITNRPAWLIDQLAK